QPGAAALVPGAGEGPDALAAALDQLELGHLGPRLAAVRVAAPVVVADLRGGLVLAADAAVHQVERVGDRVGPDADPGHLAEVHPLEGEVLEALLVVGGAHRRAPTRSGAASRGACAPCGGGCARRRRTTARA